MAELNDTTKISTKPAQMFAIIAAIFVFGSVFSNVNERLNSMEKRVNLQEENTKQIQFIRESVIRIEGKLDTKQDKYLNKKYDGSTE